MANICSYKSFALMVKKVLQMKGWLRALFSEGLTVMAAFLLFLHGSL